MKRFFLLLVAILLYVASVAFGCPIQFTTHYFAPRSIVHTVGNIQWILHKGEMLRYDRQERISVAAEDVFADSNACVLFTSKNSPLVQGSIDRVRIDDEGRLIANSARGEVAIFDGREWTLPRIAFKADPSEKYHIGIRDVMEINGVLHFITPYGVQRIDMHRNEVQRVQAFPERMTSAHFLPTGSVMFFTQSYHGTVDVALGRMDVHTTQDHDTMHCKVFDHNRGRILGLTALQQDVKSLYDSAATCIPRPEEVVIECVIGAFNAKKLVLDLCTDRLGNIYLATTEGVRVIKAQASNGLDVADPTSPRASVYPNPASTVATLELEADPQPGTMANIVDIMGRVVRTQVLDHRVTQLDVNGLKGAYRIVITNSKSQSSVPLVVVE